MIEMAERGPRADPANQRAWSRAWRRLDQELAEKMKAVVQRVYGEADVLELIEVPVPAIHDHDVLLRVRAAGLHIGDWHVMTGLPYLIRAVGFGLRVPNVRVRGMDVAGIVEAVGAMVTEFTAGDEVFGTCEGAFAEYACAPEANLAIKPARLSFEEAAVVPTSAFAALQALRDRGELRRGQRVLIIGATGDVGSFAVQLAKGFGAEVTGVGGTAKIGALQALGADHVIDYHNEDFSTGERRYDLVLDTGGNRPLSELRRVLAPHGIAVLVGGEGGNRIVGTTHKWLRAVLLSPFVRQKLRPLASEPNQRDLRLLKTLLDDGTLTPAIDRTFPLAEVPDAFRYLKSGRGFGKIAITV
jgi:NADPH:quinone reductase-like Zn-dependent oxidoreductase